MSAGVVIIGGGQGGFQTAASLRIEGFEGPITLVSDEPGLPYQRPPLSKGFLTGQQQEKQVVLRPESFYARHNIRLLAGERAVSFDSSSRTVRLGSGASVPYEGLVLAVGARNRLLPVPGADLDGVCYLRTLEEARALKQRLEAASRVVVIGGGFVGLEIAASARKLGKEVTVLEAMPRLMARVVAPLVSTFCQAVHGGEGVDIKLNAKVVAIRGEAGKLREVVLGDGTALPADVAVVGIGIVPNLELSGGNASFSANTNGFLVDEYLRTAWPGVFAIGDCALYPNTFAGGYARLESVQNAVDQAACAARAIAGKPAPYRAAPWFWSDQFDMRLQMVGLPAGHDQTVVRGDPESGKFSLFYFRQGTLCAVDSINQAADHMAGRKLLASKSGITPGQAADASVNLKDLAG